MGRAAVRAAIADYLSNAGITFLGTVNRHPPAVTTEGEFFASSVPGTASGAVIFMHLRQQAERRIALGGVKSGKKVRPYTVSLICFFRSKKQDDQDVGDDNDAFLDSLVAAIEADRTAASFDIFQWGEGDDLYGLDIKVNSELPRALRLQMKQVFSVVEVTALEMLTT